MDSQDDGFIKNIYILFIYFWDNVDARFVRAAQVASACVLLHIHKRQLLT